MVATPVYPMSGVSILLRVSLRLFQLACVLVLLAGTRPGLLEAGEVVPVGRDGRVLNLDFEDGTLRDWTVMGRAFEGQPVRGDRVHVRRPDMKSAHVGEYWIGGYEVGGDDAKGTMTSAPFKVTQPWGSFRFAGGAWPETRLELVGVEDGKVFFEVHGVESEELRPVVVDLKGRLGREIQIRLVDDRSGHWGHVNFDHFRLHATRPVYGNEFTEQERRKNEPPPADAVLYSGLSPLEAAKVATLPPGFAMHLFAGEPDVRQPIAFALDDRGRVWVAEGYTYPKRAAEGQGKDRILVFEDTKGTHTFDKRTVFMEGLNLVSGLEVGFGGVWVGAAPYLMYIPVEDWENPKPAGKPKVLLDGWNYTADTHETLNTFTWGPDGWLYGCHGVFCPSHVGKPGAPENERQWMDAGVWRYHPLRHVFEVFTEGGSNPWGIDFDEKGQLWAEMCVIPHLWHMIQGARIERQGGQHFAINAEEATRLGAFRDVRSRKPLHPYIYEDIKTHGDHVHYAGNQGPHAGNGRSDAAGGGHAHAGMMVYLGDSWPEEYWGKLYMGNIHGQRLNMDIPERRGSGFVGRHGRDFLNFNDTWSQTLNQTYDQDGSVYIIDWYDKNQCHHNNEDGHDRSNGRIYKVVYGNRPVTRVDLASLSDEALVVLLSHPNEFQARHARRLLMERGARKALDAGLVQALREQALRGKDTVKRLRALWALDVTGNLDARTVLDGLRHPDEYVRAWTIQLAFEDLERLRGLVQEASAAGLRPDPDIFQMAEKDPSAFVRLYLASAMQRAPQEIRSRVLGKLVERAEDSGDANLPLMIWFAVEPVVVSQPAEAMSAAVRSPLPKLLNFTARRLAQAGTPESIAPVVAVLRESEDRRVQLEVLRGMDLAYRGRGEVAAPAGWDGVEPRLTGSSDPEVKALGLRLALGFGSPKALAALRVTLDDAGASTESRRMSLEALLARRDAGLLPVLLRLLDDGSLRGQAIRALASYDDAAIPGRILGGYPGWGVAERRDALNTLVSRVANAKPLLASVEAGKLPRQDLTADIVRQLRNLKNAEVDSAVTRVWGAFRESTAERKAAIEKYKRVYYAGGSQPGDASRGRAVFDRVCVQCHTLFDNGGKVGPDLTGSNRADLDYILQNIVDPNAVIPNDYRSSTLEMKDDRVITGIVRQQDDRSMTVVTANEVLILPKGEVKSATQSDISMMPEGLLDQLKDQEVRDLIYYLGRPGQVPAAKP